MKNCYQALKTNGLFGIDLMNFWAHNKKIDLINDCIAVAVQEGFYLKGIFPVKTRSRKQKNDDKENIYVFTKSSEINIPNYISSQSFNMRLKEQEENALKTFRKNNILIAIYDIFGKLKNKYKSYNEAAQALHLSIDEIKTSTKPINNNYIKIYRGDEQPLPSIKVKLPVCLLDNIYFYSLSDVARHLNISRQAVSKAKINKKQNILSHPVQWLL